LNLANNRMLRRSLEQLYRLPFVQPSSRLLRHNSLPGSREIRPVAEEHHRAIVDAIEHREGARAESLGREHVRLSRSNLEGDLADRNFLEIVPGGHLIKVRNADRA